VQSKIVAAYITKLRTVPGLEAKMAYNYNRPNKPDMSAGRLWLMLRGGMKTMMKKRAEGGGLQNKRERR
jgi:hypothetical protein